MLSAAAIGGLDGPELTLRDLADLAQRRASWAIVAGKVRAALGWTRLCRDLRALATQAGLVAPNPEAERTREVHEVHDLHCVSRAAEPEARSNQRPEPDAASGSSHDLHDVHDLYPVFRQTPTPTRAPPLNAPGRRQEELSAAFEAARQPCGP